jgi:hypothetical protein
MEISDSLFKYIKYYHVESIKIRYEDLVDEKGLLERALSECNTSSAVVCYDGNKVYIVGDIFKEKDISDNPEYGVIGVM